MLIINTCFIAEQNLVAETCIEQCALKSTKCEEMGNFVKRIKISHKKTSWYSRSKVQRLPKRSRNEINFSDGSRISQRGYQPHNGIRQPVLDKIVAETARKWKNLDREGGFLGCSLDLPLNSHCIWVSFRNGLAQFKSICQCEIQPNTDSKYTDIQTDRHGLAACNADNHRVSSHAHTGGPWTIFLMSRNLIAASPIRFCLTRT